MDDQCRIDETVYFDGHTKSLITHCTKCCVKVSLGLQGLTDPVIIKEAVRSVMNRVGMCPINLDGSFPPDAHPELSFWGYWQGPKLMQLIDLMTEKGLFGNAEQARPVRSQDC